VDFHLILDITLIKEIIMEWLAENWLWIVFAIAFVAMHMFGHGGHGAHGNHESPENNKDKKREQKSSDGSVPHHH
jgi:hypothetical protein